MQNKSILEQTKNEITDSLFINSIGPILSSEYILNTEDNEVLSIYEDPYNVAPILFVFEEIAFDIKLNI